MSVTITAQGPSSNILRATPLHWTMPCWQRQRQRGNWVQVKKGRQIQNWPIVLDDCKQECSCSAHGEVHCHDLTCQKPLFRRGNSIFCHFNYILPFTILITFKQDFGTLSKTMQSQASVREKEKNLSLSLHTHSRGERNFACTGIFFQECPPHTG